MNEMTSLSTLTILEQSQVSPPPTTIGNRSLTLTFFDFMWLSSPPVHTLLFYELPINKTQFTETIIPRLKIRSLSITLKHFFPYVGNLIMSPTLSKTPEIRYLEGDSLAFTSAQCNFDFNDLSGNHPRDCGKFYPLIPQLKCTSADNESNFIITISVFSVQVTFFPNCGFSIGMSAHHSLGDVSSHFCFLKAWTSIVGSGTDELFLSNGTLPIYDRLIKYPKLDEIYLRHAKVERFSENYQLPSLDGPTNKVRAKFIFTPTMIKGLKKLISTNVPTLAYVSSFTVACAYIWSCMAESHNDELQLFGFSIDCRTRMDQPIPMAYFGNCITHRATIAETSLLKGKEGFLAAAKFLGENLHKILMDKDGVMKNILTLNESLSCVTPTVVQIGVAGTPKLKFYEMDFGWGKPKIYETISIDYNDSISMNSSKESNEDMEIGVCLGVTEMKKFVSLFNHGLEAYI